MSVICFFVFLLSKCTLNVGGSKFEFGINWAVCTKVVLRPICNKVHPFRKSEMECDIGFVFFDLVITMNPHFAKKTNLVYHHILIYLEAKWQTYAFFRVFS